MIISSIVFIQMKITLMEECHRDFNQDYKNSLEIGKEKKSNAKTTLYCKDYLCEYHTEKSSDMKYLGYDIDQYHNNKSKS